MNYLFLAVQALSAILLVVLILLQAKGTGLGATFGGDMGFYGTKRGAEKALFVFTIIVAFIFLLSSALGIIFR
jgi:protein translocase SecG subunit